MLPVIAIVGRPNVGKSTLFNCLTHSRSALVAKIPGLTRDRQYGQGYVDAHKFIVIDTGGITDVQSEIDQQVLAQVHIALAEADAILFLVDAQQGLTAVDELIATELRKVAKPIFLVVNKIDGLEPSVAVSDFYQLGFSDLIPIAAAHRKGIAKLVEFVFTQLPQQEPLPQATEEQGIKIVIVGRPNVGKSTLVNRILGEERVIVSEVAGTTRDSIYIPFKRFDQHFVLIDTAGIRRRGKVHETIEKFSIIKTLQAIEDAQVAIFLMDATEGLVDQDLKLIGHILEAGKALVLAVNKWDHLLEEQKQRVKNELSRRLTFLDFVVTHFISALHGTNVGNLFASIEKAYQSATLKIGTAEVNRALQQAVEYNAPPAISGRRIKLRYAHLAGHNPPSFIIYGNQTHALPMSYKRYLMNFFRTRFKLVGTPIRLDFRTGENPFKK